MNNRLNKNILLKNNNIELPKYRETELNEKWLHIGLGNFHRSHQAYYFHKLLNKKKTNWSISTLEIRKNNDYMVNELCNQDCLYTLIIKDKFNNNDIINSHIIGSITSAYFASKKNINLINEKILRNKINFVSLTITENGYHEINENLDVESKDIISDLENNTCLTIYGVLHKIIFDKFNNNMNLNILSCDNISNNGEKLSKLFLQFCELKKRNVINWVEDHIFFPNSMVDRITPKINIDNINYLKNNYNYIDYCVIESEPYIQWIIEDVNIGNFPNLTDVGVEIVKDVNPYQDMKMMMLNASHCSTSFLSVLNNLEFVYETFNNKIYCEFIEAYLDNDVIPNLKKNFYDYNYFKKIILKRFSNKALKDSTLRTTINGSKNLEIFIKPSFKKCFDNNMSTIRFALIYSSWLVFLELNLKNNNLNNFKDDNYKYMSELLSNDDYIDKFIYNNMYPGIYNLIDDSFINNFFEMYNLIKQKKIYEAIKYAI